MNAQRAHELALRLIPDPLPATSKPYFYLAARQLFTHVATQLPDDATADDIRRPRQDQNLVRKLLAGSELETRFPGQHLLEVLSTLTWALNRPPDSPSGSSPSA